MVQVGGLPLSFLAGAWPRVRLAALAEFWWCWFKCPSPQKSSLWLDFPGNWKPLSKLDLWTEAKVTSVCNPRFPFCASGGISCSTGLTLRQCDWWWSSSQPAPWDPALEQNPPLCNSNSNHFLLNPYFNIPECPSIKMLISSFSLLCSHDSLRKAYVKVTLSSGVSAESW